MLQNNMLHILSGGRDKALYAELGRYFLPDGRLKEPEFRAFIRDRTRALTGAADVADTAGEQISAYIEQVLEYLDEKGMGTVTHQLLSVALDEAAKAGLEKITVNPLRVQRILTMAAGGHAESSSGDSKYDPDEKRKKILEGALNVFTERGFHETTIDEVATVSGVAKGTVYRYFQSKEDLLDQLLVMTSQKVVDRFSTFFTGQESLLEEIRRFVEQWVIFIEENHSLYRLIQAEGIIPHSGKRAIFYEYLLASFPMIKERIIAMDKEGALISTSFHTVAYGMLGFIDGVVHKWFRSGMTYPLREEIPIIQEVLFNGFVRHEGLFAPRPLSVNHPSSSEDSNTEEVL